MLFPMPTSEAFPLLVFQTSDQLLFLYEKFSSSPACLSWSESSPFIIRVALLLPW